MLRTWIGVLSLFIAASVSFAGTSNSLMDVAPSGKALIVANNDNGTVTLIDLDAKEKVREIKVGKKPEGVTWIGNGPLAAVTLYHEQAVVIIDTDTGKIEKNIKTAAEPYGIVADAKGTRAWVSHEYPGVVSEIDLASGKVLREIPAGAMPRGIALAADGKRIYVTEFYTGILNAIDLESGKIVDSWKGHTTDNLARHVVLHPTRPKAYMAAHSLHGQGGRRRRLDLPAAQHLRSQARRGHAAACLRHGHLQRRLCRHQPLGVGHLAGRQTLLHHLRRHQRHELHATSSTTTTRKSNAPANPFAPAKTRVPSASAPTANRSTSTTPWISPSASTPRTWP